MANGEARQQTELARAPKGGDTALLVGVAALVALVHMLTNGRYGFHRDELQFLSDARHLDWGFVAYPPMTPFLERIGLEMFGLSLVGLRSFSVLAQAMALVLTGLMTREFGGGRLAQMAAVVAVALAPVPLFEGTEFQYTSFDYLLWVLAAYFVARLLRSGDARWWMGVGLVCGLGMETKYTMLFLLVGIVCGVLLTPARRFLRSRWFWAGVGLFAVVWLPNLLWQARQGFISLAFLRSIHARDVRAGGTHGFLPNQLWVCNDFYALPLWVWGLVRAMRSPRYRMMGWMYVVPLVLFLVGGGRYYYLAGAYPMLVAMGAPMAERWVARLRSGRWRTTVAAVYFVLLVGAGAYGFALVLPLAGSGPLKAWALAHNDALREELGWDDLLRTVAGIRDALPPDERAGARVLAGNYGQAGAVEMLGDRYGLSAPISMTNSWWLRGAPEPAPTALIVLGFSRKDAERTFAGCRVAGRNGNVAVVRNEESESHPEIFVCGEPRAGWSKFWSEGRRFG